MAVILYLPEHNGAGARLHRIVKEVLSERNIEWFGSLNEMSQRLHEPIPDVKIAILYLTNKQDLLRVCAMGDFLGDIRLILVLPDGNPETISKAHLLRPRFITYVDNSFDDLGLVLKQMYHLYGDVKEKEALEDLALKKQKRWIHNRS